jgi:hypothetical protein
MSNCNRLGFGSTTIYLVAGNGVGSLWCIGCRRAVALVGSAVVGPVVGCIVAVGPVVGGIGAEGRLAVGGIGAEERACTPVVGAQGLGRGSWLGRCFR